MIEQIYTLVKTKNYAGVMIDFENVTGTERDMYSSFLNALHKRLQPEGYYTAVALPVKRSDNEFPGYDYGGIASAVDFVFLMAYDYHEAHSGPGPVAPIDEIQKTLDYAIRFIRRDKIILGVPRYGFDWTMENGSPTGAKAVSVNSATNIARQYQVPILYSETAQQPHFSYTDEDGKEHIVWFEDARARAAKALLTINYRLKGLGSWQLGLSFPQAFYLIDHFFRQRKVL
ncbi:glycosyl hydrolase family 18 protein [Paenibacillus sp. R14(2021)]|uniref:glycosyl hydrolase family 18 protein n=1 Tax=Paenibacillus sp. R14(2021) TaxID=2859228 RepID=UPI00215782E9|nr:glycosyl hydrolase family 18 protein [Paenibacillus sp. R14(2021)]